MTSQLPSFPGGKLTEIVTLIRWLRGEQKPSGTSTTNMKIYEADQFLFNGMIDTPTNGEVLRNRGVEKVLSNNNSWMQICLDNWSKVVAGLRQRSQPDFTGENIRFILESLGLYPNNPNAWGALIQHLVRKKLIVKTGQYRQPTDKSSHARAIQCYRLP